MCHFGLLWVIRSKPCYFVFSLKGSFTSCLPTPLSLSTVFLLNKLVRQVNSGLVLTEAHIDLPAYLHGHCVCGDSDLCFSLVGWKSSDTDMRFFVAFVMIFFYRVGFIGCKSSIKCPSGQFMLKNQCVLCHPTCSECNGHELFECTTCGVGELNFFLILTAKHNIDFHPVNSLEVLAILRLHHITSILYLQKRNTKSPVTNLNLV